MVVNVLSFAKVYNGAVPPPAALAAVTTTGLARLVTLVMLAETFTSGIAAAVTVNDLVTESLAVLLVKMTFRLCEPVLKALTSKLKLLSAAIDKELPSSFTDAVVPLFAAGRLVIFPF